MTVIRRQKVHVGRNMNNCIFTVNNTTEKAETFTYLTQSQIFYQNRLATNFLEPRPESNG